MAKPTFQWFMIVWFLGSLCVMFQYSIIDPSRLGDIAAESGRSPKGEFVCWPMQLLSMTVQQGNAEMYHGAG